MDLSWGDERAGQFITNVGLITTNGKHGHNVMACEWTHHISYSPGLIACCIRAGKATSENIKDTKEFGVNLCSSSQNVFSSISGGYRGKEHDKISALKELGYNFFKAEKINVLMVDNAAANIECKLFKKIELGSHTMFVGEVVKLYELNGNKPLAYFGHKYFEVGENIAKPSQDEIDRISNVLDKYKK